MGGGPAAENEPGRVLVADTAPGPSDQMIYTEVKCYAGSEPPRTFAHGTLMESSFEEQDGTAASHRVVY